MDKKDILYSFGKKLRQTRESKNLTQAELAELIGLSVNFIGMVERGERNTSYVNVYKLIKALDYSLGDFFKDL